MSHSHGTKSKISSHAKIEDFEHFGTSIPKDVTNFTMDRAVRGRPLRPLTKDQKERNRKISLVRAPGERPFSVIKKRCLIGIERDIRGWEE